MKRRKGNPRGRNILYSFACVFLLLLLCAMLLWNQQNESEKTNHLKAIREEQFQEEQQRSEDRKETEWTTEETEKTKEETQQEEQTEPDAQE